jgi:hypothetical protein
MTPQERYGERLTARRDKIVVDTGVLISAFAFGGTPEKAVKKALAEADIHVSPALLEEYRNVPLELESKGKITHFQMESLIAGIAAFVANAEMGFRDGVYRSVATIKTTCCLNAALKQRQNSL